MPGHGLCMTQAKPPPNPAWDESEYTSPVYSTVQTLLLDDASPEMIIENITNPSVDNATKYVIVPDLYEYDDIKLRQYGCVDLEGRAAGYTGSELEDLYFFMGYNFTDPSYQGSTHVEQDLQGTFGSTVYSVQGNIVSDTTVTTLSEAFSTVEACDLVERLYLSLAAIYENESDIVGDIRCFDSNFAAGSSAFIHVDNSDGTEMIHIENETPDTTVNPWPEFKAQYEKWREENPCGSVAIDLTAQNTSSQSPLSNPTDTEDGTELNSAGCIPTFQLIGLSALFQVISFFLL